MASLSEKTVRIPDRQDLLHALPTGALACTQSSTLPQLSTWLTREVNIKPVADCFEGLEKCNIPRNHASNLIPPFCKNCPDFCSMILPRRYKLSVISSFAWPGISSWDPFAEIVKQDYVNAFHIWKYGSLSGDTSDLIVPTGRTLKYLRLQPRAAKSYESLIRQGCHLYLPTRSRFLPLSDNKNTIDGMPTALGALCYSFRVF